jgi:hypothetical protein
MTKTEVVRVPGELVREGKSYPVQVKLTVKPIYVDERPEPVNHIIEKEELEPTPGLVIEDGKYTLLYSFNGKQETRSRRVERGMLLVG